MKVITWTHLEAASCIDRDRLWWNGIASALRLPIKLAVEELPIIGIAQWLKKLDVFPQHHVIKILLNYAEHVKGVFKMEKKPTFLITLSDSHYLLCFGCRKPYDVYQLTEIDELPRAPMTHVSIDVQRLMDCWEARLREIEHGRSFTPLGSEHSPPWEPAGEPP